MPTTLEMTHYQRNIQLVSHSFAAVDLGQVGLLNVGNVKGTMSH